MCIYIHILYVHQLMVYDMYTYIYIYVYQLSRLKISTTMVFRYVYTYQLQSILKYNQISTLGKYPWFTFNLFSLGMEHLLISKQHISEITGIGIADVRKWSCSRGLFSTHPIPSIGSWQFLQSCNLQILRNVRRQKIIESHHGTPCR